MTEGWCYGTMSVSAQSKGHYCHKGLWEMTPDVLLLILALAACLTEPVHCKKDNGTRFPETEAQRTEERISKTVTHTPAVTNVTWNSTLTVDTEEESFSGGVETYAQVTLEHIPTTKRIPNVTRIKALNTTAEVKRKSVPYTSFNNTTLENQDDQEQNNNTQEDDEQEEDKWKVFFIIIAVCLTLVLLLAAIVARLVITHRRRNENTADPENDDPYLDDEDGEKVPMPMFEDDMPSVMELEMEDFEKWMIKGGSDISMDSKQRHPS
ncbi:hypothetical protein PGIGA_G00173620 [Pangasianodon gigas]|uniref:Uncharacterized protein n=1 Tax=Pangasianodon gigas TaxID=30993 RepID=A0ACC5XUF0_PANGG|nr:hypothetical protein [Pangasianodon gigas]